LNNRDNVLSALDDPSPERLETRIAWLAHDLDKTISTLAGDDLARVARREGSELMTYLAEWRRRQLPRKETIVWADELLLEAQSVLKTGRDHEGVAAQEVGASAADLFEILRSRRSIRKWLLREVDDRLVRRLVEAASWAPSACNRQSCRYLVVTNSEGREAMAKTREKWLANAPVLILVGADKRNYLPEEVDFVPYMDAAVASQNMLLMAHGLGLGAVIVKATEKDIRSLGAEGDVQKIERFYETLRLPSYFLPVAIIAIGYPARIPRAPPRRPIDEICRHERFGEQDLGTWRRPGLKVRLGLLLLRVIRSIARHCGIRVYTVID
jgi:nitroreductase